MTLLSTSQDLAWEGTGGVSLAGTLTRPAGGGPAPAFLLLAGSGPTDRDGNQPPQLVTDLLKDLAQALAGLGIASLRYDKRGVGAGARLLPREPAALADFARWENFAGDAAAAFRTLARHDGIDAARVGILGHSEGGLIALDLAASGAVRPAALVLAATPGRPMARVLRDQLGRLGRAQGAPEEVIAAILDENDRILKDLADGGGYPSAIHPGLRGLYPPYLEPFWRSLAALDPAALAARHAGPVLVLAGREDVQVSADRDAGILAAALGAASDAAGTRRLAVIAGASHNLKAVAGPADPGRAGPIHREAAAALAGWLHAIGWT